ncbi:hypothetical protein EDB86DRAFT_2812873, partial [Lactarius hatsudake]
HNPCHNHGQNYGEHAHGDGHVHDHRNNGGPSDNLFAHIDRDNIGALNSDTVIKPWDERMDKQAVSTLLPAIPTASFDADIQSYIEHHHLHGFVELRSLLLKSSPDDQTCQSRTRELFFHKFDFEDADKEPLQQFDVTVGWDVGEYAPTKFSNASSPPFFSVSQSAETTRIYYVGFLGQWSERKQEPVITVYESQANIADHERIQGTEGNFFLPSH